MLQKFLKTCLTWKTGNGADADTKEKDNKSAFMASELNDNPDIINSLLDNGADANTKDEKGRTALMWASEDDDNLDVIDTLIGLRAKDEKAEKDTLFGMGLGGIDHRLPRDKYAREYTKDKYGRGE